MAVETSADFGEGVRPATLAGLKLVRSVPCMESRSGGGESGGGGGGETGGDATAMECIGETFAESLARARWRSNRPLGEDPSTELGEPLSG
mmetsp:Transcript_19113/g.61150  ORF Transcript_19113/g.61150 Transcript_19113/m.61150 type:complete len:91 (+) Transcript_19113:3157-3429(+)